MTITIQQAIEQRISANMFDPNQTLTAAQIEELVGLATRAPTAFNFQNWHFIAVQSIAAKERLKAVAYGQQKIVDASVTFIVCGKLEAHKGLAQALKPSVASGLLEQSMADAWVQMAHDGHEGNPIRQRDEAIRSASLGAMTLMLAAQGMGLVSGPMIGFDPAGVAREFNLSDKEIPAMLVAVGFPAAGNWPQKPRLPVKDALTIV
ncbi:nitroreductase family protein [Zwartia sp.]|uniref:nitroreductase family protein n=1 Tax=Zwartia sp. TaxID=2978004 RepID=UPI00271C8E85|nr:nitroreductase family protein [Zwartia sp.]MDO9023157.1 nitroreductase family protein [Zwartia sp.]